MQFETATHPSFATIFEEGYVSHNDIKLRRKIRKNDTLAMRVDLDTGYIEWSLNGEEPIRHQDK